MRQTVWTGEFCSRCKKPRTVGEVNSLRYLTTCWSCTYEEVNTEPLPPGCWYEPGVWVPKR